MTPRTIVLTGASSGIGEAAAKRLAARGHRVVPLGRDPVRTRAIGETVGVAPVLLDLADLQDVRRAATDLLALPDRIDVLALNAGAMVPEYSVTRDGIENTMQTNHVGHFLLERLLHDRLVDDHALVVFTCSLLVHVGRIRGVPPDRYRMVTAYGDSKLAGLLFIRELARRSRGTGLTAVAFHPGTVRTPFAERMAGPFEARMKALAPVTHRVLTLTTPDEGASTLVRLASTEPPRSIGAHYLGPTGRDAFLPHRATDRGLASRVWTRSEQLAGL